MSRHLAFHVIQRQCIAYLPCLLLLRAVKQSDRKLKALPSKLRAMFTVYFQVTSVSTTLVKL